MVFGVGINIQVRAHGGNHPFDAPARHQLEELHRLPARLCGNAASKGGRGFTQHRGRNISFHKQIVLDFDGILNGQRIQAAQVDFIVFLALEGVRSGQLNDKPLVRVFGFIFNGHLGRRDVFFVNSFVRHVYFLLSVWQCFRNKRIPAPIVLEAGIWFRSGRALWQAYPARAPCRRCSACRFPQAARRPLRS